MKAEIMRMANKLIAALEIIHDDEFVDDVCYAVMSADPFSAETIAKAVEEEDD